ncbi:MAG: energy-coupling factor ABC transporter permease [Planctomycetes bacterium]|nr:energy-coupling factor ABC transporter permease [Planctomycetota bacterium]
MHIPDGFLSAPVLISTGVVSLGCVAAAVVRAKKTLGEQQVPMLGVTAAFIFAAQMLNFPVAGGTSGHFVGATMAAILLGPLNAILVMAVVLIIQAMVFFDGGITAVGANVFNMGVVGAFLGWLVYMLALRVLPKGRPALLGASGAAAWIAVVASSATASVELGISGTVPLSVALPSMVGVHCLIGVGEALITMAVVTTVAVARPDLIPSLRRAEPEGVAV